jgi:hypothetical protein
MLYNKFEVILLKKQENPKIFIYTRVGSIERANFNAKQREKENAVSLKEKK